MDLHQYQNHRLVRFVLQVKQEHCVKIALLGSFVLVATKVMQFAILRNVTIALKVMRKPKVIKDRGKQK